MSALGQQPVLKNLNVAFVYFLGLCTGRGLGGADARPEVSAPWNLVHPPACQGRIVRCCIRVRNTSTTMLASVTEAVWTNFPRTSDPQTFGFFVGDDFVKMVILRFLLDSGITLSRQSPELNFTIFLRAGGLSHSTRGMKLDHGDLAVRLVSVMVVFSVSRLCPQPACRI